MNYLLDTCVLSEFTRKKPNQAVISWVDSIDESLLFISVITIGEIQRGIMKLPESRRKNELASWMNNGISDRFASRILSITQQTMLTWGNFTANQEKNGHKMPILDSMIAALAVEHNMILVTRNTADFTQCPIQTLNPWV